MSCAGMLYAAAPVLVILGVAVALAGWLGGETRS